METADFMKILERREKNRQERKAHEEKMKPIKAAEQALKKKLGRKLTNGERNFIRLEHVSRFYMMEREKRISADRRNEAPHRTQRCLGRSRDQRQARRPGHDGCPSLSQAHTLAVPEGIAVLDEEAGRGPVGRGDVGGRNGNGKDVSSSY